jgi:hypothetical protein
MARSGRIGLDYTVYYRKFKSFSTLVGSVFIKTNARFKIRAGSRAYARYKLLPPELFGLTKPQATSKSNQKYYIGGFDDKMTEYEAKLILGIDSLSGLSQNDLRKKHRQAMIMNHPDKGGSAYLAMKINEARDLLAAAKRFK